MANPQPILFSPACHSHLLPSIADLHIACISHDAVIAYFTPPIEHSKVLKLWQEYASGVSTGDREIIVILAQDVVNNPSPDQEQQSEVAGVVMLGKPVTETGPFRGQVLKLFVSPSQRRLGIAKRLMMKLEEIAREQGKTLLQLDTETGSPAEAIYPRLGYTKVGVIPDYGISPADGTLRSETFFYKNLLRSPPLTVST